MLRTTTTTKPSRIVFVSVAAAAVISVGYITALAVLAPEQLAEATVTASDLVCSGCVGTSDIANNAVTSAKIGSGQVKTSDIGTDAVTTAKIGDGQVGTSDIASNAINTAKILDGQVNTADIANEPFGVGSVDINPAAVRTADIGDGQVTTVKIANDAIKPNVHQVEGVGTALNPGESGTAFADCPPGEKATGGGFITEPSAGIVLSNSNPGLGATSWSVTGLNTHTSNDVILTAFAVCIGSSP